MTDAVDLQMHDNASGKLATIDVSDEAIEGRLILEKLLDTGVENIYSTSINYTPINLSMSVDSKSSNGSYIIRVVKDNYMAMTKPFTVQVIGSADLINPYISGTATVNGIPLSDSALNPTQITVKEGEVVSISASLSSDGIGASMSVLPSGFGKALASEDSCVEGKNTISFLATYSRRPTDCFIKIISEGIPHYAPPFRLVVKNNDAPVAYDIYDAEASHVRGVRLSSFGNIIRVSSGLFSLPGVIRVSENSQLHKNVTYTLIKETEGISVPYKMHSTTPGEDGYNNVSLEVADPAWKWDFQHSGSYRLRATSSGKVQDSNPFSLIITK